MEENFYTLNEQIMLNKRKVSATNSSTINYETAYDFVTSEIPKVRSNDSEFGTDIGVIDRKMTKKDMLNRLTAYKGYIKKVVLGNNISVSGYEDNINAFINECAEDCVGYSILADAFYDKQVTDIFVTRWNRILIKKHGIIFPYGKTFRSEQQYIDFLFRVIGDNLKEINIGQCKIVDFELYGERGCATSPAVSPEGYSLTVRKHSSDIIPLSQIIDSGIITKKIADFLLTITIGGLSYAYGGFVGSGKTTTLQALLNELSDKSRLLIEFLGEELAASHRKMVVCEDTQEMYFNDDSVLRLVTTKSDDPALAVSLEKLIYTALRLNANQLVIGEVRGLEVGNAIDGAGTGQSTIFSIHGKDDWNVINRIVTKCLQAMPNISTKVVERIVGSAMDYIIMQDDIPTIGRVVTSISEVGYDYVGEKLTIKQIMKYNFENKQFEWKSGISKEKADILMRRGIPFEKVQHWMNIESEQGR